MPEDALKLKGSHDRVLFQNSEGNINMGVFFNDPDVDIYDIYWYNLLATVMEDSIDADEGLIVFDRKLNTLSCYVELHRNGLITDSTGINFICYSSYKLSNLFKAIRLV